MKIVIEIDENLYTRLFDNGVDNYNDAVDMAKAIRKGTPLPNGHGDLKDEREVVNILLKYAHSEEGRRFANFLVSEIKDAPTIIEADKENTDEEE